MKKTPLIYRACYNLVNAVFSLMYKIEYSGKENIPPGAAIVCANHTSNLDPFFAALAFGKHDQLHLVGKEKLFKIPVMSVFLPAMGMISVNREISDLETVKSILGYLKKDEKIGIFPEGTRVKNNEEVSAKGAALKIAERAQVPIVPVFIPDKKPLFRSIAIVIGTPYYIEKQDVRRSAEDYATYANELMKSIKNLNPKIQTARPSEDAKGYV